MPLRLISLSNQGSKFKHERTSFRFLSSNLILNFHMALILMLNGQELIILLNSTIKRNNVK